MSSLPCPQCTLPITITDRFTLHASDGEPIEHVRISCPASHHYLMAYDRLLEATLVSYGALATPVTATGR